MAKYRKISPCIWNDEKVRGMTDRGKLALLFLLTHPHMTPLGAIRANAPGLACELGWEAEAFREAFGEALAKGIAKQDEKASLIWFPRFLKHNPPESPNVVKSWLGSYEDLPECQLKISILSNVSNYVQSLAQAFQKAFREAFGKALAKGMPNQEQEQEQEEDISLPVETHVNEDTAPAREEPQGKGEALPFTEQDISGQRAAALDLSGPGMEFLELRDFYSREIRSEGPLAGFPEYKQLKAARDGTGASHWPGLARLMDDLAARKAVGTWGPGYELGLGRYLRERTWLSPIRSRASPASATPTEFQRQQRDRREMMRLALELREREEGVSKKGRGDAQSGQRATAAVPIAEIG